MSDFTASRKFGIEIEALGCTPAQAAAIITEAGVACDFLGYTHDHTTTWKVVTDATVRNGFEVVSPVLVGEDGINEVRKVVAALNEAGCDVDHRCGIHVHVQVSDLTPAHVANIFNRYSRFESSVDSFMPRSRRANNGEYCQSLNGSQIVARDTVAATCEGRGRFNKINLQSFVKYGTMEFRQHSGSLNVSKVTKWVNFLLQFVEASTPAVIVNPAHNSLVGNGKRIIDMLEVTNQTGGMGLPQDVLERMLDADANAVQTEVSRLRSAGYEIDRNGTNYTLVSGPETPVTPVTATVVDTLFNGISADIARYYERRVATLAA